MNYDVLHKLNLNRTAEYFPKKNLAVLSWLAVHHGQYPTLTELPYE